MKFEKSTRPVNRYIALDIHKEYVLAGGMNAAQEWTLPPRRIGIEKFREWSGVNLREGDAVVLETTTNVWDIYDIVAPLVGRAVDGFGASLAQDVTMEVGSDVEKFPTEKHFCSWLGLAPKHEITGGKVLRNRTIKTHNRAGQAFRMAAQSE